MTVTKIKAFIGEPQSLRKADDVINRLCRMNEGDYRGDEQ